MNCREQIKQLMIIDKMQQGNQKGFTIIELSIATSVFAVVLLVAMAGFMQIGRYYYKGIAITQTQETATQILSDLSENIQAASSIQLPQTSANLTYFCAGNTRYSYQVDHQVDAAGANFTNDSTVGLVKDTLPAGGSCLAPCAVGGSCALPWSNPVEMLGNRMRLEVFDVTASPAIASNFYNVNLVVFYGDNDQRIYETQNDKSSVNCTGGSHSQQFCAVAKYSTSLFRGRST